MSAERITAWRAVAAILTAFVIGASADGQETVRASVDSAGGEGNGDSGGASISGDGRFLAFSSRADDLVPFDGNGQLDVFVRDLATGVTERVSVSTAGVEGDFGSDDPAISADGRFVVFTSGADNLVAGDTNGWSDVFVHDRKHATTWRVSVDSAGVQGSSYSSRPAISADGRFVAFESRAGNLVPGDTNGQQDIFVHDNLTGATERISVDSSGNQPDYESFAPRISADGNRIAFVSVATNLVAGDTNGAIDIFVHEHSSGITTRVNLAWNGAEATADSDFTDLSADGTVVTFGSWAPNLVPNDLNGSIDTFAVELATGAIERVSVDSNGAEGDSSSDVSAVSADGRYVAFSSWADNLVAGDTNLVGDVLVRDRKLGLTWRASIANDGAEGDSYSWYPSISASGHEIAFEGGATNLVTGDTNGVDDVFVRHEAAADRQNYGAGYTGTLGVPDLKAQRDPTLGASITLDLGNSAGAFTSGLLVVGFGRADIPTSAGGHLLVDALLWLPLPIPDLGLTLDGSLPDDESLDGFALDLQLLEVDAGATHGIAFSRGLELTLGR